MKKYLSLIIVLMSLKARANTCKRLMDCVSEATALTGLKYIYPEKMFNDKHELNVEMILNKSDAGKVLSEALAVFDFVIIPTNVSKVFKIIPANELLDHPNLPTFQASKSKTPAIPKTQDPIHLIYQTQKGINSEALSKSLHPLVSRFGRIINLKSGAIIIIDRASSILKILPILQAGDSRP